MSPPKNTSRAGLSVGHFLGLGALLVAPGLAVYRGGGPTVSLWIAGGWAVLSGITYLLYARDKRQAQNQGWREPERGLHLLEMLGGWPGAFLAQCYLRHKSAKAGYQFVFWLIVILHELVAIDSLRGWPMVDRLLALVR